MVSKLILYAIGIVVTLAVVMKGKFIGEQLGGFGTGLVPFGVGLAQAGTGAGQAISGFGRGLGTGIQGVMEPIFWASSKIQQWWPGDVSTGQAWNRERGLDIALYRERSGRV